MSAQRIQTLRNQLQESTLLAGKWPLIIENDPDINWKPKHAWFKSNGWGYKDTQFVINEDKSVTLTGNKYTFSNKKMPYTIQFVKDYGSAKFDGGVFPQSEHIADAPVFNDDFLNDVCHKISRISFENSERVMHSYGHTLQEMSLLKYSKFERYCDAVAYPKSHEQVQILVRSANDHNVALIPYGGGTNVTEGLLLTSKEKRMIISVDLSRMNKVKYVNKQSMIACVEAGILGSQLEAELAKYGVCFGHEPDSVEFSTLGGWIATKASGMKKNAYGNIEDLIINLKIVTSKGVFERKGNWQRVSNGPDILQIVIGSEGLFGIITEAIIKIKPLPEKKLYDSIILKDFPTGVKFMETLAKSRVFPASVRLMDNNQVAFALAFKEQETSMQQFAEKFKQFYLSNIKGIDIKQFSLVTIAYEGTKVEVEYQMQAVNNISLSLKGINAGSEIGIRGYFLTFVIAYIRDFVMENKFIAESYETTVAWENILSVCNAATEQVVKSCKLQGVKTPPFITYRLSQIYDTCATIYCYFGFSVEGLENPSLSYSIIENDARATVIKHGGSLSHHHGIGKLRKGFLPEIMPDSGKSMLRAIKKEWDPKNIFATGNIID